VNALVQVARKRRIDSVYRRNIAVSVCSDLRLNMHRLNASTQSRRNDPIPRRPMDADSADVSACQPHLLLPTVESA